MNFEITKYLVISVILFLIGILGIFLIKKNIIIILMSIELMLLAININFVIFSVYLDDMTGQVFALFILTIAAAESATAAICARQPNVRSRTCRAPEAGPSRAGRGRRDNDP